MTSAEQAYLFRHAMLRVAAYDLQLPTDRAWLHEAAAEVMEQTLVNAASGEVPDDQCADIARHIQVAREFRDSPALLRREQALVLRAARHAERNFDNAQATRFWLRRAGVCEGADSIGALHQAARVFARGGDIARGAELFQKVVDATAENGDTSLHGLALGGLATTRWIMGDRAEAETMQRRALELLDGCGAAERAAAVRINLANQLAMSGRLDEALPLFEHAARALAAAGSNLDTATAAVNHAICLMDLGRGTEARSVLESAIALTRPQGDSDVLGALLAQQARCVNDQGQFEEAIRLASSAAAMCRRCGNLASETMALGILAQIQIRAGHTVEIDHFYDRVLNLCRESNNLYDEGMHLCEYALALTTMGRDTEARPRWRRGMAVLRRMGDDALVAKLAQDATQLCADQGIAPLDESSEGAP